MPVTEQELIQLIKQKGGTDQQIQQAMAMRQTNGIVPQQQKPQSVNDMIRGINPVLGDAVGKMAGTVQQLAGVNNSATTDPFQKAYAEQQAKSMFADPIDTQINRDYKVAATNYRNAGLNDTGQRTSDINQQNQLDFKQTQDLKNRAMDFRKEFLGQKPVQQFHEMIGKGQQIDGVLTAYLEAKASGKDPQSVQFTDQALITLLNKILDPMSVVRESEYARSQEGQTLINRFSGKIDQMLKQGGAGLTDQDRIELAKVAQTLVNGAGNTFNQFYDSGTEASKQWGLDPNLVMSGYSKYSPMEIKDYSQYGQQQPPQQTQEQGGIPTVGGMFNGQKVKKVTKIG